MTHQYHERLVHRGTKVKDLYQVICAAGGNEVFVLVKVATKDVVRVRVDPLHILAGTQIPDATHLITCRAGEDCIVSRVPYCLVGDVIMQEATDRLHHLRGGGHIPQFNGAIVRGRQRALLVQMVPFAALDFGCVAAQDSQWLLRVLNRPEPERAVAACSQDFVGVSLRKADVEGRVWRRNLYYLPHRDARCLCVINGDPTRTEHAKILALGYCQQVLSEWAESR